MAKKPRQSPGWRKPEGMSKEFGEKVLAGKYCGARRNRMPGTEDAHFCHHPPSKMDREKRQQPPYRCRLHGGETKNRKEFKRGHKVNTTHGIYTDAVLPGEEEFYASLQAGNVDEEIRMCKLRLRRAMIMETRQRQLLEKGKAGDQELKDSMYLKESSKKMFVETDGSGARDENGKLKNVKKSKAETVEVRTTVDYSRAIKDISNELYKFEQIRTMQLQAGSGESDHDRAKRVQAEIAKIKASIEVVEATIVDGDGGGQDEAAESTQAAAAEPDKIGPFEKGGGDVDDVDDEDGDNDDGDEGGL